MSWFASRPEVTCVEVFCGSKATAPHFQPFSMHWNSIISTTNRSCTASMECHTNTSAGTILLKPHYCSPKRSWDVKQWMWNTPMAPHTGLLCHQGSGTELCWGHMRTKPHLFFPGDDCSCSEGHTGGSVEQGCCLEPCSLSAQCTKCQPGKWAQTRQI